MISTGTTITNRLEDKLMQNYSQMKDLGLFFGKSGFLLYLLYKYKETNDAELIETIENEVSGIVEEVNSGTSNLAHTFSNGYIGFAWILNKIKEELEWEELENILNEFDSLAIRCLETDGKNSNFDFMHGGLGTLFYLISRKKVQENKDAINNFLSSFNDALKKDDEGYRLQVPFYLASEEEKKLPFFNLGMAHGNPSYIAILSLLYKNGMADEFIRDMIDGLIKYLFSCKIYSPTTYLFPGAKLGNEYKPSRLSWCYGDLGVAISLHTAQHIGGNNYTGAINEILDFNAQRKSQEQTGHIHDACFCHGFSGNAFIFNRLGHYYKNQNANDAALYWKEKLEHYCRSNEEYLFTDNIEGIAVPNYSLLEGSIGVAMSLNTLNNKFNDSWSDLFFLQ